LISPPQFSAQPKESLHLGEYVDTRGAFGVQDVLKHATVPSNFRPCFHLIFFLNFKGLKNKIKYPNLILHNSTTVPKGPTPTAIFLL